MEFMKFSYVDASAAVKLVTDEPRSDVVKNYFNGPTPRSGYITALCFAEALGVLKRKWWKTERDRYFANCYYLIALLKDHRLHIDETVDLSNYETFFKAEKLARDHGVDLSDALQLVTIKYGRFSPFVAESKTLFITADKDLADAARKENVRVWNCMLTDQPPDR
jgi:predicted nucleic acid-binding protein